MSDPIRGFTIEEYANITRQLIFEVRNCLTEIVGYSVSLVLAALMNANNTEVETLFLLPPMPGGRYWLGAGNELLRSGFRLSRLVDFAEAASKLFDATLRSPAQAKS